MEKFSYIVKYVYHHGWLQKLIDKCENIEEYSGITTTDNHLEFIYEDVKDYNNMIDNIQVSSKDFMKYSYIYYMTYTFMTASFVTKKYRLVIKNSEIYPELVYSKEIPYRYFPEEFVYISVYDNSSTLSTWGFTLHDVESKYHNKENLTIFRVPLYTFGTFKIGRLRYNTIQFMYRYALYKTHTRKEFVLLLLKYVDTECIYIYESNKSMKRVSSYYDHSKYSIMNLLNYDIYQKLMLIYHNTYNKDIFSIIALL